MELGLKKIDIFHDVAWIALSFLGGFSWNFGNLLLKGNAWMGLIYR